MPTTVRIPQGGSGGWVGPLARCLSSPMASHDVLITPRAEIRGWPIASSAITGQGRLRGYGRPRPAATGARSTGSPSTHPSPSTVLSVGMHPAFGRDRQDVVEVEAAINAAMHPFAAQIGWTWPFHRQAPDQRLDALGYDVMLRPR
jgi:hypothetical protein